MDLEQMAKNLGATEFGLSGTKMKRFYVIYNNKIINFGAKNAKTVIDLGDIFIRKIWRARHIKIMKNGAPAYKDKTSPSFWSYHILWN